MSNFAIFFLGLLSLFVLFLIFSAHRYKGATLGKLLLLPNETVLFEDYPITVTFKARGPRGDTRPLALARLTNKRIIIAQRTLFGGGNSDNFVLVSVVNLDQNLPVPDNGTGGAWQKGFSTFHIPVKQITYNEQDKKPYLELTPTGNQPYNAPLWIRIYTKGVNKYRDNLQ